MDPAGLVKVRLLTGEEIESALPVLARLRIDVFRAFPYLYAGTEAYEQTYLRSFAAARDALIVVAETESGEIAGCATGSAITDHHGEFAAPLAGAGHSLETIFYFGESVLRPDYRGRGIGHAFFDARETHARARGYTLACFTSVIRAPDDPRRPDGYTPLDAFWKKRGYEQIAGLETRFPWATEAGGAEILHPMAYWIRKL
jgi:GNAT superfamily N-acetyltransferase